MTSQPPADSPASEGEWIPWSGGECPVAPETIVDVRLREIPEPYVYRVAKIFDWSVDGEHPFDIIAYRLVQS